MKANAGIWIDHKEAVVVALTGSGEETNRVHSGSEKQLHRLGEPAHGKFEALHVPADDSRQREYTGHLARYYDAIVKQLGDAGSVLIFGPGEAKCELKKQFVKHHGATRSIVLETADKMSDAQIVAHVRHHFHRDPARQQTPREAIVHPGAAVYEVAPR